MGIRGIFHIAFAAGLAWLSPAPGFSQTDTDDIRYGGKPTGDPDASETRWPMTSEVQ